MKFELRFCVIDNVDEMLIKINIISETPGHGLKFSVFVIIKNDFFTFHLKKSFSMFLNPDFSYAQFN